MAVKPLHELVARDAALLKPERVVDVGCGPSDLLLELVGCSIRLWLSASQPAQSSGDPIHS